MRRLNLHNLSLYLLLLTVAINTRSIAQDIDENNFTLYTKQEGLSHNIISGIAQDSTGYIWIATYSGLNRFNGSNFVQFHSSNDSLSIPEEQLRGLVWLDNYRLAAFAGGLHIIDTRTGETRNLYIPYRNKNYQFKFNWILAVRSNDAGDIFVMTRSGFYHFDINYNLVFRFDYYADADVATIPFQFGRELFILDEDRLAVTNYDGIYYYTISKKQFKRVDPIGCRELSDFMDYAERQYLFFQTRPGYLMVILPGSDSILYIDVPHNKRTVSYLPFRPPQDEFGFRTEVTQINDTTVYMTGHMSGLYKLRIYPSSGHVEFYPQKYFPAYNCRHLLYDRDHNFWLATNKGLLRQDNNRLHIQQTVIPASIQAQFPNSNIGTIYSDEDKLYVATRGNCGLLVFNKHSLEFIRRVTLEKFKPTADNITAIAPANTNTLLLGTNGPLFLLNTKTWAIKEIMAEKWSRTSDWTADLNRDKKGNIWIAADNFYKYQTTSGTLMLLSSNPNEKIERAQSIQEDNLGNIWLAGHGLLRFNTTSNSFDRLIDSFPFIKVPDRQINSFIADEQNNLWLNSNNNGLICYNINSKTFQHFTRENGLPDNNITSMIIIGNKLWMSTYSCIACMDLRTYRISSFGKEDGFPDIPGYIGSRFYYDGKENKLYIGLSNTIVQFDPGIIFQRGQPPRLFIESLTTGDQKKFLFPGSTITAPWRNNEITVTIGSINFFTSNSQRFAYRLVKDDSTHWQQLGTQNTFSISNLSPGHHRIQVKLYSASNRWPEQISEIDIVILSPFWMQTWFMALAVTVALLAIYLLLKWRTTHIRKKERAKTHIQKLIAQEYKNQFELEQISNYFSSSLASKKNVDEVLWDVAKNLIGRMNYVDCMIYVWNKDKTKMVQKASYGPKGDPAAIRTKIFDVEPGQGVVGHVMQTKEPLLISDTRTDHRYRVDDIKRLSELCVPIIHNNELIGVIDSEHHVINHFKERDIKILTTIATLLGNKIKQIESEQSLEIKQKELAFLNQQLAEAQLSALQTQMNPHFIFNSLNSIKGMILGNQQQKASRYLSKFAQMIRITLNQSKEVFTTLYENTEHLESYLTMEKLRFDDSFTFTIITDDEIDKEETLIPTMMIQPLAENAIWHGLMPKEGEKKLLIRFSRISETISCTIEDNGVGINHSEELKKLNRQSHQSVGLSNLRNRIKILNEKYNMGCTFEISDLGNLTKEQTGTRVVLGFNIINYKPVL